MDFGTWAWVDMKDAEHIGRTYTMNCILNETPEMHRYLNLNHYTSDPVDVETAV